jgi:penicillin amidase
MMLKPQNNRHLEEIVSTRLPRIFVILVSVLLILLILIGVTGVVLVRRPFPQTKGTLHLPGLHEQVDIFRDPYGVPHIYATNSHDLFMAQGFVHAQDRFWQMEFWRRSGSGTLSEILGPSALESDRFIRTVGWHRAAAEELELCDETELGVLNAYAEGVNTYIEQRRGRLGLEFTVLGLTGVRFDPEPWTPLNSLTYAKLMAWDLGGNRNAELTRALISARVGIKALDELIPPYQDDHPTIVTNAVHEASLATIPAEAFDMGFFGFGEGIGSNNWVISGENTESGKPLLANDTHLGIQMPSIWYEVGLHCDPIGPECPFNVVGFSFASIPGVIIGHNEHIAWGVTNLGPDVQDLFIEKINPEDPNQYEFKGLWEDMEIIREEITVAGQGDPDVVNVRITRHGPIINDVIGGVEEEWSYGWQPLAFSWTALQPGTTFRSMLLFNTASNWDEFRTALSYWDVPSQNFVYADVDGNIGYQAPGRIPIRASGDGTMPVPGWTGTYDWIGYIPFDSLPRAFNPAEGYIATANNAVVGKDYPYFISTDWAPGYRARRIVEMIEADASITVQDIMAMHGDNVVVYAQDILPFLLQLPTTDPDQAQALDYLRDWNFRAERESVPAAIFESLRLHLMDRVFGDELGEQLLQRSQSYLAVALSRMLPEAETHWFDDVTTPEVENRDQILLLALGDTIDELSDALGEDMSSWKWGDLHTATFRNQSLGSSGIGIIEAIFNRGPVAVDGTGGAVNATSYQGVKGAISTTESYTVAALPSMRQIVDLEYFERSLMMHTTGQSGHPFHRHYDDMIDPWRNIQYHPMLWTRGQVEAAAETRLTLTP